MRRDDRDDRDVLRARLDAQTTQSIGCWIFTGSIDADGYGKLKRHGRMHKAHRLAWEFARGPIPRGLFVLHRCDNRRCVNPAHLFLGTNKDNVDDMIQKGRQSRGEQRPQSKLTTDDVLDIRRQATTGASRREIAAVFGVHPSVIGNICHFQRWRHVADETGGARARR